MPDIQNVPSRHYIGPRIIPHLWDPIAWSASEQCDALAIAEVRFFDKPIQPRAF